MKFIWEELNAIKTFLEMIKETNDSIIETYKGKKDEHIRQASITENKLLKILIEKTEIMMKEEIEE